MANEEYEGRPNRMTDPHEHASNAMSPGISDPGEPGYEGAYQVGDEGGVAGPEAFQDTTGGPFSPEAYKPGSQEGMEGESPTS